MKDLTKYIESILESVNNTCEVNYVNNIYEINVVRDYFNSEEMYKVMVYLNHNTVMDIMKTLKIYIPKSLYVIRVKEINIPISFIPLHYRESNLEYKINSFGS
jgi:histone acetyltransferase (RNA polymerase elongator complex component)